MVCNPMRSQTRQTERLLWFTETSRFGRLPWMSMKCEENGVRKEIATRKNEKRGLP